MNVNDVSHKLQILMGYLIYVTHMTPKEAAILFKWLSYVVKISSMQTTLLIFKNKYFNVFNL